jgi:hypothetical protein
MSRLPEPSGAASSAEAMLLLLLVLVVVMQVWLLRACAALLQDACKGQAQLLNSSSATAAAAVVLQVWLLRTCAAVL